MSANVNSEPDDSPAPVSEMMHPIFVRPVDEIVFF
jgi:hypothetical protein